MTIGIALAFLTHALAAEPDPATTVGPAGAQPAPVDPAPVDSGSAAPDPAPVPAGSAANVPVAPAAVPAPAAVRPVDAPARTHVSIGIFQSATLSGKFGATGDALYQASEANLALHAGGWVLEGEAGAYYTSAKDAGEVRDAPSGDVSDADAEEWTGPNWSVALGVWRRAARTGKLDILVGVRGDLWGARFQGEQSEWVDDDGDGVGVLTPTSTTTASILEVRGSLGMQTMYWINSRFALVSGVNLALISLVDSKTTTVDEPDSNGEGGGTVKDSTNELDLGGWPSVEIGVRFVL